MNTDNTPHVLPPADSTWHLFRLSAPLLLLAVSIFSGYVYLQPWIGYTGPEPVHFLYRAAGGRQVGEFRNVYHCSPRILLLPVFALLAGALTEAARGIVIGGRRSLRGVIRYSVATGVSYFLAADPLIVMRTTSYLLQVEYLRWWCLYVDTRRLGSHQWDIPYLFAGPLLVWACLRLSELIAPGPGRTVRPGRLAPAELECGRRHELVLPLSPLVGFLYELVGAGIPCTWEFRHANWPDVRHVSIGFGVVLLILGLLWAGLKPKQTDHINWGAFGRFVLSQLTVIFIMFYVPRNWSCGSSFMVSQWDTGLYYVLPGFIRFMALVVGACVGLWWSSRAADTRLS